MTEKELNESSGGGSEIMRKAADSRRQDGGAQRIRRQRYTDKYVCK